MRSCDREKCARSTGKIVQNPRHTQCDRVQKSWACLKSPIRVWTALWRKVVIRQPLGKNGRTNSVVRVWSRICWKLPRAKRAHQLASFRMAWGALIIKEKLGISDRQIVEQIRENPYLQYFIGQSSYSNELPFGPSLLVHFRQLISPNLINKAN